MAIRLKISDRNFETDFAAFLTTKREVSDDVDMVVRAILRDVQARGDDAVIEYTERFDRFALNGETMRIAVAEADAALQALDPATRQALDLAARRITSHHQRQMPVDDDYVDEIGVRLGSRWTPIDAVGLYVPGGAASYPSSVLMNALPARVAGVTRMVMVVPAPDGVVNPVVLAAARIAGIDEIYRIGGAQAIAALAYGTATVAAVDKIVGPGNAYVAAAKRQVFGTVGIDMIAGPSEVLVIADGENDPEWIAADLLAQAEHDEAAQAILVTDDRVFADRVEMAVARQLERLGREKTAAASWAQFGAIIEVDELAQAVPIANRIAAEHLELAVADPDALLAGIRHAGAVFIGRHTPEVIGDYVGGSNHVLPTARSARFSSGLSVLDYVKRTSVLRLGAEQLRMLGPAAIQLAESEGLAGHARSVSIRMNL